MTKLGWICAGGALGSGARYLVVLAMTAWVGAGFPWGTLAVNVVGSFLIGLVLELATNTAWLSPLVTATLTTGVLGGFTTYSAFNFEVVRLLRGEEVLSALAYLAATLLGCLVAGVAGLWAAKLAAT